MIINYRFWYLQYTQPIGKETFSNIGAGVFSETQFGLNDTYVYCKIIQLITTKRYDCNIRITEWFWSQYYLLASNMMMTALTVEWWITKACKSGGEM